MILQVTSEIARLVPLGPRLLDVLCRRIVAQQRLLLFAEVHQARVVGPERLQTLRQAGLFENEVLHHAEEARAGRHRIGDAVREDDAFHGAGAADVRLLLEQEHVTPAALQVIGGHQTVDAGADHDDPVLPHSQHCTVRLQVPCNQMRWRPDEVHSSGSTVACVVKRS